MTSYARVAVSCPHCNETFLESARLIRVGGSAWCPGCQRLFSLDSADPKQRKALREARMARDRRRDRIATLRQHWGEPVPADRVPRRPSDLIKRLDALIERLNTPQQH